MHKRVSSSRISSTPTSTRPERALVEDGRLLYVDEEKLVRDVQGAGERIWSKIHEVHHFKKAADEVSPPSFRPWEE